MFEAYLIFNCLFLGYLVTLGAVKGEEDVSVFEQTWTWALISLAPVVAVLLGLFLALRRMKKGDTHVA